MLADQAAANGARVVDVYARAAGARVRAPAGCDGSSPTSRRRPPPRCTRTCSGCTRWRTWCWRRCARDRRRCHRCLQRDRRGGRPPPGRGAGDGARPGRPSRGAPTARWPARLPATATWVAADLTDDDAPARVRDHVLEHHGGLTLLVNNAGASWRATFAEGGYANVRRTMEINFDAVVRLTEALLPSLRASAPSAIVNVSSVSGRIRPPAGGRVLRQQVRARRLERRPLRRGAPARRARRPRAPRLRRDRGLPCRELTSRALTRWAVSTPEKAAQAVADAGLARSRRALRAAALRPDRRRRARAGAAARAPRDRAAEAGGLPGHAHRR